MKMIVLYAATVVYLLRETYPRYSLLPSIPVDAKRYRFSVMSVDARGKENSYGVVVMSQAAGASQGS